MADRSVATAEGTGTAEDISPPVGSAANAWLAAIIASSDDAIVSKNLDGIVTSWNRSAEKMFGWTAAEMVGHSIRRIIPADRQSEEDEVLSRIRRGERVDHFETVRQRKDGSLVDISLTVSPIVDDTGRIVGASKVARDISERRNAERALQESVAIKDQFLSLVSHELRTPISIILGNGHLLQKRDGTLSAEDRAQSIADITFHAERLQRIIENLLLLTRAEAEREFELEVIHVTRLVEAAVADSLRRHPERRIEVRIDGPIPAVIGEATITTMVIENLLNNAVKYSPASTPIDVFVTHETYAVEVHVMDRGIGLAEEELPKIFSPFYRTERAQERAGGMGLGLAVCRTVIESQGGTISAGRRPGGGADFWFTLQVADDSHG